MPIADYEFRYMLQKSISPKARIDVILHSSDNPKTDPKNPNHFPEKRYRDLFPKNELSFYYDGFKDYFN
jgi:hypothetical protein